MAGELSKLGEDNEHRQVRFIEHIIFAQDFNETANNTVALIRVSAIRVLV